MGGKTLGELIRELRNEKDWSLRELGEKVDVTAAFLSDVELGRRFPTDKMLEKLAHVLKTTVEALKSCDTRPPVQELKKLSKDPEFALAFRTVLEKNVSPAELMKLAERKPERPK